MTVLKYECILYGHCMYPPLVPTPFVMYSLLLIPVPYYEISVRSPQPTRPVTLAGFLEMIQELLLVVLVLDFVAIMHPL